MRRLRLDRRAPVTCSWPCDETGASGPVPLTPLTPHPCPLQPSSSPNLSHRRHVCARARSVPRTD
eukprot:4936455-Lingulodinium_polyedra.AAC.1